MSVQKDNQNKILGLRLIPLMMSKMDQDYNVIRDLPSISDVEHMIGIIQFIYNTFEIEDKSSDLLSRPQHLKEALKKRYVKYLQESLTELNVRDDEIIRIISKVK